MRFSFFVLFIVFISCETKTQNNIPKNPKSVKQTQNIIAIENRKFPIGDFDNDKIEDTAFVNYKWNIETNEIECGKNNCDINIVFKKNIPNIAYSQSLGIVIMKTEDINHDNSNEIIVFSRTHQGWWNEVSVWSLKNMKWFEIAETSAFISDDKDFKNRVINQNGKYFLVGENMSEEDENGDFKKVKIKL